MESSVNTDLMRSRVDVFILGSLYEKDGYGYDILNYIYSKTNGHYEMKQSSIYSVLKRLEKQGLVASYLGEESNGGRRRYYSLTDAGRDFLINEQKEWAYTRTLLDNLVSDKDFDLDKDTPPFKASDLRPMTKRTKNSKDDFDDELDENAESNSSSVQSDSPSDESTAEAVAIEKNTQSTHTDQGVLPGTSAATISSEVFSDTNSVSDVTEEKQELPQYQAATAMTTIFEKENPPIDSSVDASEQAQSISGGVTEATTVSAYSYDDLPDPVVENFYAENNYYQPPRQNSVEDKHQEENPIHRFYETADMQNIQRQNLSEAFPPQKTVGYSASLFSAEKTAFSPNTERVFTSETQYSIPPQVPRQSAPIEKQAVSQNNRDIPTAYRKVLADTVLGKKGFDEEPYNPVASKVFESESEVNGYKNVFSDIYDVKKERVAAEKVATTGTLGDNDDIDYRHINDLKNRLKNEGYNLQTYKKTENFKLKSQSKVIFSTKIVRDTSILSYLFLVVCLLILYRFESTFKISGTALLIIGLSTLLIPIAGIVYNLAMPKKKLKSNFNFKLSMSYAVSAFIFVYVIDLLICLLTPSISYTIKDAALYGPCLIALAIPFSIGAYALLLNSRRYHVK